MPLFSPGLCSVPWMYWAIPSARPLWAVSSAGISLRLTGFCSTLSLLLDWQFQDSTVPARCSSCAISIYWVNEWVKEWSQLWNREQDCMEWKVASSRVTIVRAGPLTVGREEKRDYSLYVYVCVWIISTLRIKWWNDKCSVVEVLK